MSSSKERRGGLDPTPRDATTDADGQPRVPHGWTRTRWIARLRTLANACSAVNPKAAAMYRQWAKALERETPDHC